MIAAIQELFLAPLFIAVSGFLALSAGISFVYHRLAGPGRRLALATGVIGTPVHELAHAVAALLFGMRVDRIDFYRPDPASSQLGSVDFRYNPHSPLHRVGLLVVGLAPLIAGAAAVEALLRLAGLATLANVPPASAANLGGIFEAVRSAIATNARVMLEAGWMAWLALVAAYCIALHSFPSRADFGHAGHGLVFTLLFALALAGFGFGEVYLSQSIEPLLHGLARVLLVFSQLAIVATIGSLCLVPVMLALRVSRRIFYNS